MIEDRLWKFISPEPNTGCWLWTGAVNDKRYSYGSIRLSRKRVTKAHRLSYEIYKGTIPKGMCVCHKCDVSICVNPEHLFLGTQSDNHRDMTVKGRGVSPLAALWGDTHPSSKLKSDDVRAIRCLLKQRLRRVEIAERFGVSVGLITLIHLKRVWANLPDEEN